MTGRDPLAALAEQVIAEAEALIEPEGQPLDLGDVSRIDSAALARLAALTHQALAHRRPGERAALLAMWEVGDTAVRAVRSPRDPSRPALASIIGGRVIVLAELTELVPVDDLL